MMTKRELYIKAADLIESNGLARGAYWAPHSDRYCMIGALRKIAFGGSSVPPWVDDAAHNAYASARGDIDETLPCEPTVWSDNHSAEDVITFLRKMAENA